LSSQPLHSNVQPRSIIARAGKVGLSASGLPVLSGARSLTSRAGPLRASSAPEHSVPPELGSPDRANMRQLRIKIMNAPAAVTPMKIMAATAKSRYAVGRSSSSVTIWFSLTSLWPCAQTSSRNEAARRQKNTLATHSLNLLRRCVKYNLGRRLVLPSVPRITPDDRDQGIAGRASASDKKLRRGPLPR
jgi:hypothetical protein